MNYDLIIKLAKLANNNPNDNEANAAARKVCKLLAEGEYKFGPSTTQSNPPRPNTEQSRPNPANRPKNPYDIWAEIIRDMQNQNPYSHVYDNPDPYRNGPAQSDRERQRREEVYEREYRQSEDYRRRQRDIKLKEEMNKRAREQARGFDFSQDKTGKKCSRCGKNKLTTFIGPDELFTCNDCLWSK